MENDLGHRGNGEAVAGQPPPGAFTGLVSLQLADLIQMVCLSRWDLIIRVSSVQGKGVIQIREGRIDHAQTESLQGDAAFFELFRWTDGQFEMLPYKASDVSTVGKPWEHLLLEAMRQRDEALSRAERSSNEVMESVESPDTQWLSGMEDCFDGIGREAALPSAQSCSHASVEAIPGTSGARLLKVLVVEDSPFFARQLKRLLESDTDIEVIATAKNGQEALDILSSTAQVDLVTLDVEMPVMPGGTALKHIMIRHRVPALVISAFQPNAMGQIFEYMELGAVDFVCKPSATDDIDAFGCQLRDLARKASSAQLSHFRRLRKGGAPSPSRLQIAGTAGERADILLVLGAEGAYVDWLRLPWYQLCDRFIVVGLQKLPRPFLSQFCRLVEKRTGAPVIELTHGNRASRGALHLANGGCPVSLKLMDTGDMEIAIRPEEEVPWREGIYAWLEQIAEQGRHRANVLCLSAAHQLTPEIVERLMDCEARLILPPRENVLIPDLVDGVRPYAHLMPSQVVVSAHENLLEVLTINE